MSEAVTVPKLMMTTSVVSEESLAMDTYIHRQTDRQTDIHTHAHTQSLGVLYLRLKIKL